MSVFRFTLSHDHSHLIHDTSSVTPDLCVCVFNQSRHIKKSMRLIFCNILKKLKLQLASSLAYNMGHVLRISQEIFTVAKDIAEHTKDQIKDTAEVDNKLSYWQEITKG